MLAIIWIIFRVQFLEKYFHKDVRIKKEIELFELNQRNMTVAEYVAKFEEFANFYPHYNGAAVEGSKYINFENGLRPEIKQGIGYQEICRFSTLVNKCRTYDEEYRARSTHYKRNNQRKGKNQYRGKPYSAPTNKGKQRVVDDKNSSGGWTPTSTKYFKCVELVFRVNECKNNILRFFKCGKTCHRALDCRSDGLIFYN